MLRKFLMKMNKRIEIQIQTMKVVIRTQCHRWCAFLRQTCHPSPILLCIRWHQRSHLACHWSRQTECQTFGKFLNCWYNTRKQGQINHPCATFSTGIHKLITNVVSNIVNGCHNIAAIVVDNLYASPSILTQHNDQGDDTNCGFHGHFCHERQNVQSLKNREDCVVHN